jgi:rod shape determining protein RodA
MPFFTNGMGKLSYAIFGPGKISTFFGRTFNIDWTLFAATVPLLCAGLTTMNSFAGKNSYFDKQLIWVVLAVSVFFIFSFIDFRFLRRTSVIVSLYIIIVVALTSLFAVGSIFKGAQSWFNVGLFAIQPIDPAKLVLILLLAKYFSRRHVEIAHIKHILISGLYALVIFGLILVQPDFGGALIIGALWLGMVFVSGISKKHLALVFALAVVGGACAWAFIFQDYQKARIITFLNPLADVRGAGYNAYQATIAVGSGELTGKGIGYGTQSKLQFLPEYQTDFIFAAFAEEWGFFGVLILFLLFGVVIWRILGNAMYGATNFEMLYGLGLAILFMSHFILHVGINLGLLPVTGTTIPFLSYGGSHIITEFAGLGILMGMRKYSRGVHRDDVQNEFLGI